MKISINGASLFFDVVGAGLAVEDDRMAPKPTLIVLHGGPGFDHALMRPYFDRFADSHQVIYLDHRGNGRSGGARETWRLAQWGDDVKGFCDALGIEKPAVYGLSFGGMVAMAYATRHPGHPAKLILSSTAARMHLDATYAMMAKLGGAQAETVARAFWTKPTPEGSAHYMATCLPLYNPTQSAFPMGRTILRQEVMTDFILGEQNVMNMVADLAKIACPTLVLAGELDPITPMVCAEEIAGAIGGGLAQLEVFETAGHGVHRDEPELAEIVLRRFLG